jgi:saccharopine dehydrogenase-like NADP-dependent oxidoreductase
MKKILLIGAGRSSAHLIRYLIQHAESENWFIRVGDMDVTSAQRKIAGSPRAEAFALNASDADSRRREIAAADLVISMLPAAMHVEVAKDCIAARRHVITPSYVADQMWPLHEEARAAGVLIFNEMGVDPGIDHMSAMRIIHRIQASGGIIKSFESYTGGLVAPESDNNPWHYKITWNPRNVVLAGYGGTARFRQHGELKYIPYTHLFRRITPVEVPGYGRFEGYANRDSLKYTSVYGLDSIGTLLRGTLRKDGFCSSWQALVDLGFTDDSFQLENPEHMTWRQLTSSFTPDPLSANLEKDLQQRFGWTDEVMSRLKWLGIFEENPLGITKGTPAEALQKCIEEKWKLGPADKDLLVMWHRFVYEQDGKQHEITSWLTSEGEDPVYTAMSRTVGLPIAIAAKHILRGDWKMTGIVLPVTADIYDPVLDELEQMDVIFREKHTEIG